MPVTIDFDWDDSEFEQKLDYILQNWPAHRAAVKEAIMEDAAGGVRREIPTSSGAAKQTVRVEDADGARPAKVVAGGKRGVDYIAPLLEGSRPHAPGPSNPAANPRLARWARRHGKSFDDAYWSIYHYGTEANDFVSGPVAATQGRVSDIATAVLRQRGGFD